jgi:hypothetical protein
MNNDPDVAYKLQQNKYHLDILINEMARAIVKKP